MVATLARTETSAAETIELSFWKRATEFINRPWHCSTAHVMRRLNAKEAHAEGLPYQEHFLVRITNIAPASNWDMQYGTAYIPVSSWLYQNYEQCSFLTVKYRVSRYLSTAQLRQGRGIRATLAR